MICHSTHASAQVAARVLSRTTAPVRSKFCLQGNACEDARNLCATGSPVCCTKTCPLTLCKKHDTKNLVSRDIQSTRCHAASTFTNWYPNCGFIWTALKWFSFHTQANEMPHVWHGALACHVIWLRGEARQVCVNVVECKTLARDGKCHFDANLVKATSCQIVAETVKGFWTALSENIRCPAVSQGLRITTQRVVKFVSGVASKYCDTHIMCLCLSVEHAALTGNSQPGSCHHQLIQDAAQHIVCPRHTAKIQRSCRPCTYAQVLEESAEVPSTGASPAMSRGRVAPCPGHSSARVCQEPFPPRTEHHRPRSLQTTSQGRSGRCKCGSAVSDSYTTITVS